MVDLFGIRSDGLHKWSFSDMGGCYGPGAGLGVVPGLTAGAGGPTVVAAMLGGTPGRARPPWPPLELPHPPPAHQPPHADGFGRYGVYSLFPGDVYAAPRYTHAQQPVPAPAQYHGLLPQAPHKECVFSAFTGAPGSPYSAPVVERGITQLQELMSKEKKPRLLEPAPPGALVQTQERRPKRRAWDTTTPTTAPTEVKVETSARPSCACRVKTPPTTVASGPASPGCSRTTPVTLKPQPQVKREPAPTPLTPCQVSEVTTSGVKVKQELPDLLPPIAAATPSQQQGGIPVGIAVARQRSQEVRVKEDPVMPPLAPIEQNLPLQPPVGYQLVRDPVSGQLLLISTGNNIADSLQRAIVWPNNATSFPSSPLLLPQAQPMAGHLLLDRLVTLATPTPPPPPTMDKRRQPTHNLLKIEEPSLAGVMPCAKSSVVIQQLSTHSGPAPLLNPQFSAIASSGSVLIQHISGTNTVQPTALIPPQNAGSVLISAQQLTTEAQSLINGQSPVVIHSSHSQQDSSATVISPHMLSQLSHPQQLPLVIGTEPFLTPQHTPQIHLQIKESPKEEIHVEPEPVDIQVEDKLELSINGCRSQATSPVACLSPALSAECQSQSQSEDEGLPPPPAVQQADASNQTDSLPPSDEETCEMPEPQTEAVDLSGLELLSTASITQIERSHSAPLADAPKIKTEIEEETSEDLQSIVMPVPLNIVIKEEVEPMKEDRAMVEVFSIPAEEERGDVKNSSAVPAPETDRQEANTTESAAMISGLGLLCDVAHRIIEEEAAASRPHSPTSRPQSPASRPQSPSSRPQSPATSRPHSRAHSPDNHHGWEDQDYLTDDYKSPEHETRQVPRTVLYRPYSPCEPAELEMRGRLAELQRLYREKQRELIKLTPRKSISSDTSSSSTDPSLGAKRGPGRPRKEVKRPGEAVEGRGMKRLRSMSPPTSPPVLEPWSDVKCHENATPPTLTPHKSAALGKERLDHQHVEWELLSPGKSPPPLSPAESPSSASKKRKVGRPKKRIDPDSVTIVAKKPRSKNSLVGLLLAKKHSPTQDNHKIRPKLKAEVKVKSWCEEEDIEWTATPMRRHSVPPASPTPLASSTPAPAPAKPVKSRSLPTPHKKPIMVLATRKRTGSTDQPTAATATPQPIHVQGVASCQLTSQHLEPGSLPSRVLVAMGGLFYAGQLSAVRPPDLYGVLLDGERSHRQQIHSREDILKDSILEVCMDTVPPPGTRVCAYWSQQYRCLYPGTVPPPSADDVTDSDSRFVCVEFDDGDNGRISLEDVRLLPQDYPVVEYDPNPLLSLGKRRRRISGASCDSQSKDKLCQLTEATVEEEAEAEREDVTEQCEEPPISHEESSAAPPQALVTPALNNNLPCTDPSQLAAEAAERERRRLKKKRKEKLRRLEGEKKHRHKHKDCVKTHKHKHKHRHHRHKHRHSKNTEAVVAENNHTVVSEEKKPLTLVVHTKLPDTQAVPTSPPILSTIKLKKDKKSRERQGSVESRSKMAAFLPERQLWRWAGKSYKRPGAKGRARKDFYKSIQRGNETISVGDCAVFLSTGRPDRPYIGRIESMWESWGSSMVVKVKWFYHPEETVGCPEHLPYPGALFESPHMDENDVQTISHKCEVLPLETYKYRLKLEPHRVATIYDYNDIYYLAGYYDPTNTSLRFEPGVNDA